MQHYSCGGGGGGAGAGGSGLHRKKLEEKDNESWTMGRREGLVRGGGPSTVLVRDFAAKMNVSAVKHKAERQRPS